MACAGMCSFVRVDCRPCAPLAPTAAWREKPVDEVRHKRDYSLTGADTAAAVASGLAAAEWYHTDVPRKQMKELMQRSDGPAIRDTLIWIAAFIVSAAGGIIFYG